MHSRSSNPEGPPRIQSGADHPDPPRATQPPGSRSATWAIPTLMGGRRGPPDTKQESYSSASILHFSTVSKDACDFQNRFQDSALKCSMRPRICRQSAIPPFASVSGGGAEIARSGRRDLVTQPLSPRPDSSIWESHPHPKAVPLSIGGGLVIETEMNEYSTFDWLYWEIRAVRSGLRTAAGCRSSCGRAVLRARTPTSGSGP